MKEATFLSSQFDIRQAPFYKEERKNGSKNFHHFPQDNFEFFQELVTTPPLEHGLNAVAAFFDYQLAKNEKQRLIADPIYYGEGLPKGDGSLDIIVPGFGLGEDWYREPKQCIQNIGYNSIVYPLRLGRNIEPLGGMIKPFVDCVVEQKEKTGQKLTLTGHSKGGLLIYASWYFYPDEIEQSCKQLFFVGSPIPQRVNTTVGGLYLLTQIGFGGDDFKLMQELGQYLEPPRPEGIKAISINSLNDPIIKGIAIGSNGNHFEVGGSHAGLLYNTEVLKLKAWQMAEQKLPEAA